MAQDGPRRIGAVPPSDPRVNQLVSALGKPWPESHVLTIKDGKPSWQPGGGGGADYHFQASHATEFAGDLAIPGVLCALKFDSEDIDPYGVYDPATGIYSPPAGDYYIWMALYGRFNAAAGTNGRVDTGLEQHTSEYVGSVSDIDTQVWDEYTHIPLDGQPHKVTMDFVFSFNGDGGMRPFAYAYYLANFTVADERNTCRWGGWRLPSPA